MPRKSFGELEETTRTPSYYVNEDYPARPEIQYPLPEWSSWRDWESSTLETDVYVWHCALLVVHARNDDDEIYGPCLSHWIFILLNSDWAMCKSLAALRRLSDHWPSRSTCKMHISSIQQIIMCCGTVVQMKLSDDGRVLCVIVMLSLCVFDSRAMMMVRRPFVVSWLRVCLYWSSLTATALISWSSSGIQLYAEFTTIISSRQRPISPTSSSTLGFVFTISFLHVFVVHQISSYSDNVWSEI